MKSKRITLEMLKKECLNIDPSIKEDDPIFGTMLFMLASAAVTGPNADKTAKFCHLPRSYVRERARRLRDNGVWKGRKLMVDWFEDNGALSLICDVLVAEGMLRRAKS